MTRSFLSTCVVLAAIASTLAIAERAVADTITLNFAQIKFEYKPQNDKDSIVVVDPSTSPPTPVQDFKLVLHDSGVGTPQNPLGPLLVASTIGIVNPDPAGLGDAAETYLSKLVQASGSQDTPTESFVVVRAQINDPSTGQPTSMTKGTVKFFNEQKGFGFVVSGHSPGQPEFGYSLVGEINPAQLGLTFTGPPDVLGGGPTGDSYFDIFTQLHFDGSAPIDPNVPLFSLTLTQVPEPSTIVSAALGLLGLGFATLRKKIRRT
jgi:hypothetical protein